VPRQYDSPPLVEALVEFKFTSEQPWDWTIPGLFFGRIRDTYPVRQEKTLLNLSIQTPGAAPQELRPGLERLQFFSEDRSRLVQVGPNLLAVNQLQGYPGWDGFREVVLNRLDDYSAEAHPTGLQSVAIRYIDRVVIPGNGINLPEYFRALPWMPDGAGDSLTGFFQTVDLAYSDPEMRLKISFGSTPSEGADTSAFLFDFEMVSLTPPALDRAEIAAWLDTAHDRLEAGFDQAFTEGTHRTIFGERGVTA